MSAEPSAQTPTSIRDLELIYKRHYPRFLRVAVAEREYVRLGAGLEERDL
jgi:hypothetical protein